MRYFDSAPKGAFSLVELSIVLVILGLLVGGILSGKSLIRASQLRAVMTKHDNYHSAVRTFRDKYFALPGDMPNATTFWGVAAVGGACMFAVTTDGRTCNGDGNGQIHYNVGGSSQEYYRAWQQLSNAGLITGYYNGFELPRGTAGAGVFWGMGYYGEITTGSAENINGTGVDPGQYFNGSYGNAIAYNSSAFGGDDIGLIPEDVYNIDGKLDDGKPASGKVVVAMQPSRPVSDCTDGANSASLSSNYLLTSQVRRCGIVFRDGL